MGPGIGELRWSIVASALLLAGCVGAITRDEFEAELSRRALGVDAAAGSPSGAVASPAGTAGAFPVRAIEQILERTGGDDLEVRTMTFGLDTLFATVEGRDPGRPGEVDLYVFVDARLRTVEPVQLGPGDRFDELAFPVSTVPFDRLDEILQLALDEFDEPEGEVTSITWAALFPGEVEVVVVVETSRRRDTVRFDLDGDMVRGLG